MSTYPTYPFVQPSIQQIEWQGPELAIQQVLQFCAQIQEALYPPRPDIIAKAARDCATVAYLLQQFIQSRPPGAE